LRQAQDGLPLRRQSKHYKTLVGPSDPQHLACTGRPITETGPYPPAPAAFVGAPSQESLHQSFAVRAFYSYSAEAAQVKCRAPPLQRLGFSGYLPVTSRKEPAIVFGEIGSQYFVNSLKGARFRHKYPLYILSELPPQYVENSPNQYQPCVI
jgi:hypothetical protein